jgi:hypothetical protein
MPAMRMRKSTEVFIYIVLFAGCAWSMYDWLVNENLTKGVLITPIALLLLWARLPPPNRDYYDDPPRAP